MRGSSLSHLHALACVPLAPQPSSASFALVTPSPRSPLPPEVAQLASHSRLLSSSTMALETAMLWCVGSPLRRKRASSLSLHSSRPRARGPGEVVGRQRAGVRARDARRAHSSPLAASTRTHASRGPRGLTPIVFPPAPCCARCVRCVRRSLDTSDWMRNGDYVPTRLDAQFDAVTLLADAKLSANPESTVGVLTFSGHGCVRVEGRGSHGSASGARACACALMSSARPNNRPNTRPCALRSQRGRQDLADGRPR